MTNKRIIVGVGLVAAVGVVFAFWSGLVPPKSGLEGTIGAAERYQSGQITDKDVVLQDQELQAMLQSDVFHKLQTDPAYAAGFRTIIASKAFEEASKTGNFTELDKKVEAEFAKRKVSIEGAKANLAEAEKRAAETQKAYEAEKKPEIAAKLDVAKRDLEAAKRDLDAAKRDVEAAKRNTNIEGAKTNLADAEKRKVIAQKAYEAEKKPEMAAKLDVAKRDLEAAKRDLDAAKRDLDTQKADQALEKRDDVTQVKAVVESELWKQLVEQNRRTLEVLASRPGAFEKIRGWETLDQQKRDVVTEKAGQAGN